MSNKELYGLDADKDIKEQIYEMAQSILAPNMQNKILGATEAIWDEKDFLHSSAFKDLIETCKNRDAGTKLLTIYIGADTLEDLSKLELLPLPVNVVEFSDFNNGLDSDGNYALGLDDNGNFRSMLLPDDAEKSDHAGKTALEFAWFPFKEGKKDNLNHVCVPAMEFVGELIKGLNKL